MHELAMASLNSVYNDQFKQALGYSRRIIKLYPDHPAGYFFYAAILNSQMEYLQSNESEAEFYKYCDIAILKGEDLLEKDPGNIWAKFFLAGAHGSKGTFESRFQRWITAFKHGWRAVVILNEIVEKDPEIVDALLGIATYDYWRSAKTKLLWWLPGVEDKREQSIATLFNLQTTGVYVKESAFFNLIDMLVNENRYPEALQVAEKILSQYPANLTLYWKKANILSAFKRPADAERSYTYIQKRIASESFTSSYNAALCHYSLLKVYFDLKKHENFNREFNSMQSLDISPEDKKRLEKCFQDALSMKRSLEKSSSH